MKTVAKTLGSRGGRALLATLILSPLGLVHAAHAGDLDRPDAAAPMPLGEVATPPLGFLEMCERAPDHCVLDRRPTDAVRAEVRIWAGRARWAAVFESAGMTVPAAAPPSADRPAAERPAAQPSKSRRSVRRDKDAARKRALAPAPKPRVKVRPRPSGPSDTPTQPIATLTIAELEGVNQGVNRAIRSRSDADAFGRADVWRAPDGPRASGDCEDYALAKRHALVTRGVDPAALSIALVQTRSGEAHAVLLVATARGEVVLDNLDPWVRPWRDVGYRWMERQAPGRPLTWVRAAL